MSIAWREEIAEHALLLRGHILVLGITEPRTEVATDEENKQSAGERVHKRKNNKYSCRLTRLQIDGQLDSDDSSVEGPQQDDTPRDEHVDRHNANEPAVREGIEEHRFEGKVTADLKSAKLRRRMTRLQIDGQVNSESESEPESLLQD